MRILLVEDEKGISGSIIKYLRREKHTVDLCENADDAYYYMTSTDYDVILMDIMLPGGDGLSLVKKCRSVGMRSPVIFVTARDTVADRITGLDAGGDDYMVKPFSLEELSARIRAIVRRRSDTAGLSNVLEIGGLKLDMAARQVSRDGEEIKTTAKEYALLEYMMLNRNIVLSREQIEQHIFSYDYTGASNMVDVYIRYLRKKIDEGREKKLIHTVRGSGYVIREDK